MKDWNKTNIYSYAYNKYYTFKIIIIKVS